MKRRSMIAVAVSTAVVGSLGVLGITTASAAALNPPVPPRPAVPAPPRLTRDFDLFSTTPRGQVTGELTCPCWRRTALR